MSVYTEGVGISGALARATKRKEAARHLTAGSKFLAQSFTLTPVAPLLCRLLPMGKLLAQSGRKLR